jgi:hypothetical protein
MNVFAREQLNGHIVDGVHLFLHNDGIEKSHYTGIALHIGVLGYEK